MSNLLTNNTGNYFPQWYLKFDTDGQQRPWSTPTDVNTTIPLDSRTVGLTVLIDEDEWWYKTGVTDLELVPKIPSIPPPVAERFGVIGEDDSAAEDRIFAGNGFDFMIQNTGRVFMSATDTGTSISYTNTLPTGVNLFSQDSLGVFKGFFLTPAGFQLAGTGNPFNNTDPSKFLTTDSTGNLILSTVTIPPFSDDWTLLGNTGTDSSINFIGTTDGQSLTFRTNNIERFKITSNYSEITTNNKGFFVNSGSAIMTNPQSNVAISPAKNAPALASAVGALRNVAIGDNALALVNNHDNIAIGSDAGAYLLGTANTIIGNSAGTNLGNASYNTIFGWNALGSAVNGSYTGQFSIAIGDNTMAGLSGASNYNIGIGHAAGLGIGSGTHNIVIGSDALFNGTGNLSNISNNVLIGSSAAAFAGGDNARNVRLGNAIGGQIPPIRNNDSDNVFIGHGVQGESAGGNKNISIGSLCGSSGVVSGNRSRGEAGISIGYAVGSLSNSDVGSILIGTRVSPLDSNGIGQLNIGNVIFGTGLYTNVNTNSNTPTIIGSIAIGLQTPTARLHLAPGDIVPNSAPFKFTSSGGSAASGLTTPEDGAIEYFNDHLYFTTSGSRLQLDRQIAKLRPDAGVIDPNGAPLKFTAGSLNTVPEDGAIEYDGTAIYYTTNGTRKTLGATHSTIALNLDNGTNVITTGLKNYVIIPYDCIITGWNIVGNIAGSITIDVWSNPTGIPTVADTITGTQKPTITIGNQYAKSNDVSTWDTFIPADSIVAFNVDSVNTLNKISLILKINHV